MFPDMKKTGLDESEAQNENRIPDDAYKKKLIDLWSKNGPKILELQNNGSIDLV